MQLAICNDDEDSLPTSVVVVVTSCRASLRWGLGYAQAKAGNMDLAGISQPSIRQHKGGETGVDIFKPTRFCAPGWQTGDRQLRLPDGSERGPPSRADHSNALQDEAETIQTRLA